MKKKEEKIDVNIVLDMLSFINTALISLFASIIDLKIRLGEDLEKNEKSIGHSGSHKAPKDVLNPCSKRRQVRVEKREGRTERT
jgi:hypothetical protein